MLPTTTYGSEIMKSNKAIKKESSHEVSRENASDEELKDNQINIENNDGIEEKAVIIWR